jgi:endonuclease/exonuclease/phosphatase family metal-dependent hydrolase
MWPTTAQYSTPDRYPHAVPGLRVATFNVRTGWAFDGCRSWPFRRRAVLRTIGDLDADLLALQEVRHFQLRWLRRRLPGHDLAWTGRNGGRRGEACPVFVRRSAGRIVSEHTLWFGEGAQRQGLRMKGARSPRIATTCRVELAEDDAVIEITNTHLDSSSDERRRRSAEQLVVHLDRSIPHLLVGDLNATVSSGTLAVLTAAGFRDALEGYAGGTFHRFTGRTDGPRIDHVLVDARFEVVGAAIVHRSPTKGLASDHWPVLVTVLVDAHHG